MITEKISELAVSILDKAGYLGASALMALESMIAPVPSEAVMPFVGFQVADGCQEKGDEPTRASWKASSGAP